MSAFVASMIAFALSVMAFTVASEIIAGAVAGVEIGAPGTTPETGAVAGPEIGAAGSAPGTGAEATGGGGRAGTEAEASGAGARARAGAEASGGGGRAGTGGPQLAGAAPVAVETIGGTAGIDPGSKNGPVKEAGCVGCAGCEVTAYELPPPKFNPDIISTFVSFSAVSYPD